VNAQHIENQQAQLKLDALEPQLSSTLIYSRRMADMLAIISKKNFAQQGRLDGRNAAVGDILPIDRYSSRNKQLEQLVDGETQRSANDSSYLKKQAARAAGRW
jgi:hypothetical protein